VRKQKDVQGMDERTLARQIALHQRWLEYHAAFLRSEASDECVLGAYRDWVDSMYGPRHEAFQARQGAELLRSIGVKSRE